MKKTNALRILDQQKIAYDTVEYEYDSENLDLAKIAAENGFVLETIYKTLVLTGDKTGVLVAVVAGHHSLSLKKMAAVSGNKKVEMVAVKDIQTLTGYIRGGCSPIGMKKNFPVYLDETAKTMERIFVNAGVRGILFSCKPEDLLKVGRGEWADIAE
jgi:Cys-tRNA(Pro)/Cys-tRNA(Cys) deacylase